MIIYTNINPMKANLHIFIKNNSLKLYLSKVYNINFKDFYINKKYIF